MCIYKNAWYSGIDTKFGPYTIYKNTKRKKKTNTEYNRIFPIEYKWIFLCLTYKYFVDFSCYLVICGMHTSRL
jgi:hypothetical protein